MIGAVCGDILGSTYEFGIGNEEVYLLHEEDHFTDDSVLTFALAEWALEYGKVPLGDSDTVAAMAGGLLLHTIKNPGRMVLPGFF